MSERKNISNQAEWIEAKGNFRSGSDYEAFRADYRFNLESRIILTGRPLHQVLQKQTGARHEIFESCFGYGWTVRQINDCASQWPHWKEDADLFIALFHDYVRFFD